MNMSLLVSSLYSVCMRKKNVGGSHLDLENDHSDDKRLALAQI